VALLIRLVSDTDDISHQGRGRLRDLLDRLAALAEVPALPAGPARGPWLH